MATGHEFEVKKYKEYELIESVIKDINVKYNSVRLVGSNSPNEKRNLILQNGYWEMELKYLLSRLILKMMK